MKIKDLIFTSLELTTRTIFSTHYNGQDITILVSKKGEIPETMLHGEPPQIYNYDIRDFPEMSVDLWLASANNMRHIIDTYGKL